jgi:hypothetical protein
MMTVDCVLPAGFVVQRKGEQGGGSEGAADEFQPFPSRHRVFVSAEEPMVTIETAPHHYRLPFS